ncbi:tribbles homolog 3 [Phyllostomus discolor]|uniref:Tribbles homolog 3 n=1 Tax=Phyllostomus discolor TaxID=89673 RepID=A0A6J2MR31_9CHIR|nr:tribbles homolog 3 [Phyllostomus discolor]XP_035865566.1 tribbles homolog 3 [Phyllostomus discolor]XP_035865567.1 tribbles homolog 3 [Phyllostomus discolor]
MPDTPLAAPMSAPSRKKQLKLDDDLDIECPTQKQAQSGPQPKLSPCPLPPRPPPAAGRAPAVTAASRLGYYVLQGPEEGGRAYWALHRPTGTEYTCQVYPVSEAPVVLEPYLRLPPHRHVARPAVVLEDTHHLYMFFPRPHGDLHSLVRRGRLPEPEAAGLFRQMAAAVAHCHQHGLVLRDLKLHRFVFTDCERTKLVLENLEDACVLTGPDDSLWDKQACPAYVGPEILSSRASYSGKAADIWSLGVALFTMLAGHYPFQDSEPILLFRKILQGNYSLPQGLSAPARCLIHCLLRREPAERLRASGILLHPWLQENPTPSVPSRAHLWGADQVVPRGPGLEEVEVEEGERAMDLYG